MTDKRWDGNPLFGDWGNSPRAQEAPRVDIPVGEPCMYCKEAIQEGDVGEMMPLYLGHHDHDGGGQGWTAEAVHRECLVLHIIGHQVGVCNCTDYAGIEGDRARAIECARRLDAGEFVGA